MGFMDKFKDATQAAKSVGGSMANMGGPGGASATAAKMNKLANQGVEHPAILKGMRETGGKDPLSGGVDYEFEVEVRPTGGEAYGATFSQQVMPQLLDGYKQKLGGEVVVKVDPDDPQSMVLWG